MTSSEGDIPEQGPVSYFPGASDFVVRDSHFTEVRGNGNVTTTTTTTTTTTIIHNYNYASTFPPDLSSVRNPAVQDAPSSSVVIQRPDPQSELLESFTALLASSRDNEDTSYHWGRIEGMFEDIDRQLTPYSRTLLKRLRQDVGDLKDVAFFTYQAYRACLGSGMGVLVRGHIKRQITACGATIKRVQQKIIDILEGWVPVWTLLDRYLPAAFAGAFLLEPDDIAAVRKDVLGEMQSLGEIVRSLELIESWAQDLFPAPIAIGAVLFSISDINKWLERSPNLLHHIKVDQIYVVEPLGDRLAIPTRFIESSEQIHMCLQLKCQKTHGAGYIDNRQYQLNESASDLAVDEKGLQSYIRGTGVQLEVTVFVRSAGIESNRCPRPVCGFLNTNSGSESVNKWMRCQMCQKKFATQEVGWTTSEVTDQQDPPLGSTPYTPATAKEDSAGHASSRLNSSEFPADTNQTHDNVIPIARVNQSWSLFQRIMVQLPKASNLETQPSVSDLDYYKPDPATPSSLTSVLNHDYPATFIRQRLSETTYGPQIPSGLIDDLIETSGRLFLWASVVLDYLDNVFEPVGALKDILHEMHGVQDGDAASKLDHLYSHILSRLKWTDTRLVIKYRIIVGAIVTWKDPLSSSDLASLYESEGITENDVQKICLLIRPLLRDYSSTRPHEHLRLIHLSVQEYLTERAPTPYRISVHRGDPSLRP